MEELQSILEKINREGVEKAEAEAARIVDAAKKEAEALLRDAREAAAKEKAEAERESADSARRAEETIRQAARDIIISVRDSVTALLEKLLAKDVDLALSDDSTAAGLASEAVRELVGPGEISAGPKLVAALQAKLASNGDFTVVMDKDAGTGFRVRLDGGRVEHDFTGETIARELSKRLRPDLAKLLRD